MRGSSSPVVRRDRKRETKSSKWETQAPVVATSKWDNIDPETEPNEPSRKKSKARHDEDIFADLESNKRKGAAAASDEDLDGAPLDDSSPETTRHSSGSRYSYRVENVKVRHRKSILTIQKERGSTWKIARTRAESGSLPG